MNSLGAFGPLAYRSIAARSCSVTPRERGWNWAASLPVFSTAAVVASNPSTSACNRAWS
ncbi:hypothetical protein ACVDFE_07005 [Lentzea chajnantorensis]